jgi:hypothetical protein
VLSDQSFQFADEIRISTRFEIGVDPRLDDSDAKLFQPRDVLRKRRLKGDVGQRRTTPDRERVRQLGGALFCRHWLGIADETLEAIDIDLSWVGAEHVAPSTCGDNVRPKDLTKTRNVVAQGRRGILRCAPTPKLIDEPIASDDLVCMQHQKRKHSSLLGPTDLDLSISVPDLERAENTKVHSSNLALCSSK